MERLTICELDKEKDPAVISEVLPPEESEIKEETIAGMQWIDFLNMLEELEFR